MSEKTRFSDFSGLLIIDKENLNDVSIKDHKSDFGFPQKIVHKSNLEVELIIELIVLEQFLTTNRIMWITFHIHQYYPTALRRVQITPKTSTNITRYLYSRGPVRQVFS